VLEKAGLKVERIVKLLEGRPNAIDLLKNKESSSSSTRPPASRRAPTEVKSAQRRFILGTPIMTTLSGAKAAARGIGRTQKIRLQRQDIARVSLSLKGRRRRKESSDFFE